MSEDYPTPIAPQWAVGQSGLPTRRRTSARSEKSIISTPPRILTFTDEQLQKKFKHASDFGISGSYNLENAQRFADILKAHVQNPTVLQIVGTYRRDPVIHYFDKRASEKAS